MSFSVLIVDDSETVRSIIAKTLRLVNISLAETYAAENGEEALRILQEKRVDLVLTDINMPVMTGVELIQRMQESEAMKGIPVIVISTEGSSTRIDEFKAMGVRAHLRKPFTPERLRETIEEVMGDINEQ